MGLMFFGVSWEGESNDSNLLWKYSPWGQRMFDVLFDIGVSHQGNFCRVAIQIIWGF